MKSEIIVSIKNGFEKLLSIFVTAGKNEFGSRSNVTGSTKSSLPDVNEVLDKVLRLTDRYGNWASFEIRS